MVAFQDGLAGGAKIAVLCPAWCVRKGRGAFHIAFIPLLVPPLLVVMSRLMLHRRAVACAPTFGLVTP